MRLVCYTITLAPMHSFSRDKKRSKKRRHSRPRVSRRPAERVKQSPVGTLVAKSHRHHHPLQVLRYQHTKTTNPSSHSIPYSPNSSPSFIIEEASPTGSRRSNHASSEKFHLLLSLTLMKTRRGEIKGANFILLLLRLFFRGRRKMAMRSVENFSQLSLNGGSCWRSNS